jgi:multidrug efflux pump subunit AcrA (membrane-fusion protein)
MPTNVIMPAIELAQETGKVLRWLTASGDRVAKGDPIVAIETDEVATPMRLPAARWRRSAPVYVPRTAELALRHSERHQDIG